MQWLEITIEATSESSEAIAEILMQCAAQGIATEDPNDLARIYQDPDSTIFKDPSFLEDLGEEVRIRAYFPEFPEGVAYRPVSIEESATIDTASLYAQEGYPEFRGTRDALMAHLNTRIQSLAEWLAVGKGITGIREVQDADWAEQWKQYYHTMRVSPRLTIAPTWEAYTPESASEVVLRLDPGSAFGTGDHPTTALCLAFIDEYICPRAKVADVGCGSGILGIGAARLGARHVDAVDIDPNAITVTEENAAQNQVLEQVNARVGTLKDIGTGYDLIVANLVADLLIQLAPEFQSHMANLGLLIVSGIVESKLQKVKSRFEELGFSLHDESQQDEWYALVYAKV